MFWRRSVADQVDEELDFHLEMVARDLIAQGWSEPDARAEARRRFGDLAAVGARCRKLGLEHERTVRRAEYLTELRQDVRLAFPTCAGPRRSPRSPSSPWCSPSAPTPPSSAR
jgi:hypothetical protein